MMQGTHVGSRWGIILTMAGAACLAGCSDEPENTAAQERADAQAVAQVMAQQTPPPVPLQLQPIVYDDIINNPAMEGAGCSFTPSGEEDAFAILADGIGFLKFEGNVKRYSPDAGSDEGPSGTRAKYDGREYSLRIAIDETAREDGEGEGYWFAPATITIVDGYDREIVTSEGRVGCGG